MSIEVKRAPIDLSISSGRSASTVKSRKSSMKSPTLITTAFQLSVIPVANLPPDPELKKVQIANPSVAALYEDALVYETGSAITSTGALTAYSGAKTGRSPLDKRIVKEEGSEKEVWWGPVNKPMSPQVSVSFSIVATPRLKIERDPKAALCIA